LSALDVIRGESLEGEGLRHSSNPSQPAVVRATFELSHDDRTRIESIPGADEWRARGAFETLILEFRDSDDRLMYLASVLTTVDGEPWVLGRSVTERGRPIMELSGFPSNVTAETPIPAMQPSGGSVRSFLFDQAPQLRDLSDLWRGWAAAVFRYDSSREGPRSRYRPTSAAARLDPSGSNLADVLLGLLSARDPRFTQIRDTLSDVVPDLGELIAPASEVGVAVAFVDAETAVHRNLVDMGGGIRQLLLAATACLTQPTGGLVVLEEPEANLHPGAERRLLRHLETWASDRLIILATHSTVFLEGAEDASVLLVTRENGASEITNVGADIGSLLDILGVRLAPILTARSLVLVEGPSDEAIIDAWFGDQLTNAGGAVTHLGGADVTMQLDRIRRLLFEARDQLGRPTLFIRDRDELTDRQVTRLEAEGDVMVLPVREIENFFLLEADALTDVLRLAAQGAAFAADPPEGEALGALVREAADAQRGVVLLKRVANRLGRPLGRNAVSELIQANQLSADDCVASVMARFSEYGGPEETIRQFWREEDEALNAVWEDHWNRLAPGEEVLTAVWRTVGARYVKRRDGLRLARGMVTPPESLATRLELFLGTAGV
jgi:AAA domain, putative AbiEii toxin, Type IV TA system